MSAQARRRVIRISALSFAGAMSVMMRGPFKASDIADETGLHRDTVYKLIGALAAKELCHEVGLAPDTLGRKSVRVFALSGGA